VPHCVICHRQVEKHSAGLQLILKDLFNVCRESGNLITGATTFPEACLVWIEDIFYSFCDAYIGQTACEALRKLETDTYQRN